MNIAAIIGVVVALAVVGGGGAYLAQQGTFDGMMEAGMEQEGKNEATDQPAGEVTGTMRDLWNMTGSARCTVTSEDPNSFSLGTAYIANGQVRADFSSATAAGSFDSHMIRTDGKLYTWSSAMEQGMVMEEAEMEARSEGSASVETKAIDPSVSIQYSCEPWTADARLFVPPADITFMDLSAFMQGSFQVPGSAGAGVSGGMNFQLPQLPQ